ncbi:MAG TPA: GntR family transcriptional regulator [Bauldia sp.]|nr:GntR family transcriptional regulator [Bauldia sp.]
MLEEEIAEGFFVPGERLDESALAARYGVSRTPIREALMELAGIGLVISRPRRGTVVASLDAPQLVEMFEVMAELEGMAGRLAARRATSADRDRLANCHEACRPAADSGDSDAYYYENERFHHAIYAASHNVFLQDQCAALHRRLKPYRRLQLRVAGRIATSFREHAAIVEAILSGEANRAQRLLREHVVVQGDRFADLIASLGEFRKRGDGAAARRG